MKILSSALEAKHRAKIFNPHFEGRKQKIFNSYTYIYHLLGLESFDLMGDMNHVLYFFARGTFWYT